MSKPRPLKEEIKQFRQHASEQFNALSFEHRKLLADQLLVDQWRNLQIERKRAIAAHKSHLRKIDDHLRNIESEMVSRAQGRIVPVNEGE